jgi:hypothetical protein
MMSDTATIAPTTSGNRVLYRFLFLAAVLFVAWFFGYEQWLKPDGRLDAVLCNQITSAGVALLRLLGIEATVSAQIRRWL